MTNLTPEQKAREIIDRKLIASGWVVQDKDKINFNSGPGIAIREYQTSVGPVDYALFANQRPVGVVEAKKDSEGHRLTMHEEQAEEYAQAQLRYLDNDPLPFVYESTGEVTRFTDMRDPSPRSRPVFSIHRPETLTKWIGEENTLRSRFDNIPVLQPEGLRDCQFRAIGNLEQSFRESRPRALIQMATGSGKTFTAITSVYRLLKYANAKRILFLVDTRNLGEQAEQEFMKYKPLDDMRKFTELYNVQRLSSSYISPDSQVCISTIQRLYSILKGEELDVVAEEENPNERQLQPKEPVPVAYNEKVPIEFFDFIIIDECHRSIYNLWKQVLDYFDAFLVGLTATPDARTFAFFHENIVSEYSHEEAVADSVNVGYNIYTIETKITSEGGKLEAKQYVDKRERLSRRKRWTQLDEDKEYTAKELDKDVVNPSQIRNIIKTFKQKLPEIFPGRNEVPKTLIFAKNDSHADDIIHIVREEFAEGNAFCKKVTYRAEDDPKSILSDFRNSYNPRIAVTVDMIATGTDVKPLECLLFMRDVKSRNYFEQMKGRGTRTLNYDDLKQVTPSAVTAKTHFVIVDAIGVTKSLKTDSRPLERKPSVPLKDLLNGFMMGIRDEDTTTSLANRLARLNHQINEKEKNQFRELAGGKTVTQVVKELLGCYNPDVIDSKAKETFKVEEGKDVRDEQRKETQEKLLRETASTFNGELNKYIENVRKAHEQIIDEINLDEVKSAGWDTEAKENVKNLIQEFNEYLASHKDEITALRIYYDQPYNRRNVTYSMVKEVLEALKRDKPLLAPLRVWEAYEQVEKVNGNRPRSELIALVSLIRKVTGIDQELTPYDATVRKNFQRWVFDKQTGAGPKYSEEQMEWLRMIRDHIASSIHIDIKDLDYAPFDSHGGLGMMHRLFGEQLNEIVEEMNEVLVA